MIQNEEEKIFSKAAVTLRGEPDVLQSYRPIVSEKYRLYFGVPASYSLFVWKIFISCICKCITWRSTRDIKHCSHVLHSTYMGNFLQVSWGPIDWSVSGAVHCYLCSPDKIISCYGNGYNFAHNSGLPIDSLCRILYLQYRFIFSQQHFSFTTKAWNGWIFLREIWQNEAVVCKAVSTVWINSLKKWGKRPFSTISQYSGAGNSFWLKPGLNLK